MATITTVRDATGQPEHTPQEVLDAIWIVGDYARRCGYADAVITPGGGTSFHRQSTLDRLAALLTVVGLAADLAEQLRRYVLFEEDTEDWPPAPECPECAYQMGDPTWVCRHHAGQAVLAAWEAAIAPPLPSSQARDEQEGR